MGPEFQTNNVKETNNVHYFTENIDIYNEYFSNKNKCFDIIYINKNNYTINDDFFRKIFNFIIEIKASYIRRWNY